MLTDRQHYFPVDRQNSMNKSFLPNDDLLPELILSPADREPVQILVIGSEKGITSIVHTLYL
jgi:hypothetical protein